MTKRKTIAPQDVGLAAVVPVDLSDLFFNMDHDDACVRDASPKRAFLRWDTVALQATADLMLECLEGLGVKDMPSSKTIVADFLRRV